MKNQIGGMIALFSATIIWGSAFVAQSVGMDYIGPFTFQSIRCFLAVAGLLPIIFIFDLFRKDGKNFFSRWKDRLLWKAGFLCSIPLSLATNLQQLGLTTTDAGKSAFLTAMYIVIVPVIGLFLGKKTSLSTWISIAVAVIGLYCLSCMGAAGIQLGDLLLLLCAVMFAIQITLVDRFGSDVDSLRLNLIQALFCALFSAIPMVLTEKLSLENILHCAIPLSYAGFLSMGLAYTLQIIGQKHVAPAPAALVMGLEAAFALLFGCLLLQETLTFWEGFGCVLVFSAVQISQLPMEKLLKKSHSHG